jgi:hypothetical protein
MKNCEKFEKLVNEYLDEEVNLHLKIEIGRHLESCKNCSAMYYEFKKVKEELKNLSYVQTSNYFEIKLRQKIAETKNNPALSLEGGKSILNEIKNLIRQRWISLRLITPKRAVLAFCVSMVAIISFVIMTQPEIKNILKFGKTQPSAIMPIEEPTMQSEPTQKTKPQKITSPKTLDLLKANAGISLDSSSKYLTGDSAKFKNRFDDRIKYVGGKE